MADMPRGRWASRYLFCLRCSTQIVEFQIDEDRDGVWELCDRYLSKWDKLHHQWTLCGIGR